MNKSEIIKNLIEAGNDLIAEGNKLLEEGKMLLESAKILSRTNNTVSFAIHSNVSEKTEDEPTGTSASARIANVIRSAGRFMHRNELQEVDALKDIKYMSSVLSTSVKKDKHGLTNYIVGTSKNNMVYGFKEWMNSKGEILPQYMYDEEKLRYKEKAA